MTIKVLTALVLVICSLLTCSLILAAEPAFDVELAKQGVAFLNNYCKKCHGDDFKHPGLDMTNRVTLLRPVDANEDPYIVPSDPTKSRLWEQVESESMPPAKQLQPSVEQKAAFKKWIEAGAHFPPEDRPSRKFLGEQTILEMIADDLDNLPDDKIPHTRYFSLAHLWNDVTGKEPTTNEDLRMIRAAVSKLVNSLSSNSRIVVPRVVDKEYQTLLAIDMRDYGWDDWHWNEILKQYPYGLKIGSQAATRIYRVTGTNIPYLRADWFVNQASRPPIYHTLLHIPANAKSLEANLGVNIQANFELGRLARAAFQKSGVSQQNRMVERHDTRVGGRYYWKSYDIKPGTGEVGDFTRKPLGPVFDDVQGRQLAAFKHDGGEIIYSLANGLQAYMLVKGNDERIDEGPVDVVSDPNQHSGSFVIANGISCMGCHKHGMVNLPKDDIRPIYQSQSGQKVADIVLKLFPPDADMKKLVDGDSRAFQRSLEEAIGPFILVDENASKSVTDYPDPISRVSRRYQLVVTQEIAARELGLPATREAAKELGLKSAEDLAAVGELRLFQDLGLGNWKNAEGSVSRENWEKAYARVAREFGIGTPIRAR